MSDVKENNKLDSASLNPKEESFDSWLNDLEDKEQPQACSIDDPECEACGSQIFGQFGIKEFFLNSFVFLFCFGMKLALMFQDI